MAVASHAEMLIGLHTFGDDTPSLRQQIDIKKEFGTKAEKQWAEEQEKLLEKKD